ncbi:MAG: hypothetical protein HOV80_10720, partial [Polyangiaceae bacterium]|nr:hypothetical protein [Polyangiaceae bacterium]
MSLFGHLAVQFGSHPENLATEALGYILAASASARRGFMASLGDAGAGASGALRFVTQHSDEEAGRPDLAGIDEKGRLSLLVEAKFWAGFTEHQPVGYLSLLPEDGALLVVCPAARLEHVWRELSSRVQTAGIVFETAGSEGELFQARCGQRRLVLQSWRRLLNAIRLELASEPPLLADVAQLAGLCDRMDSEAFIPVTSEELTSKIYRRVHEFGQIVNQ